MVDRISRNDNTIQESVLRQTQAQQTDLVKELNKEAAQETEGVKSLKFMDNASISDAAREKLEAEREVLQFTRIAQRLEEPYDAEKVAKFKDLLDSGRINEYLRDIDTGSVADAILESTGTFLR